MKYVIKSILCGLLFVTGCWYAIWYGQYYFNSELVRGVVACVMFGYTLYYMVNFLNMFIAKRWAISLINGGFMVLMFYAQIKLLQVVSGVSEPHHIETTPFCLNPHLVGPVIYLILLTSLIFGIFILAPIVDWIMSPANYYADNSHYPGKVLLNRLSLKRRRN